jgi:hypothetical protein
MVAIHISLFEEEAIRPHQDSTIITWMHEDVEHTTSITELKQGSLQLAKSLLVLA